MKIADSQVAMAASRNYTSDSMTGMHVSESDASSFAWAAKNAASGAERDTYEPYADAVSGLGLKTPYSYGYDKNALFRVNGASDSGFGISSGESELTQIRKSLMQQLMQRLNGAGAFGSFSQPSLSSMLSDFRPGGFMTTSYYSEYEEVSFSTEGQALTEDGRTISFDVSFQMSRSFMQYTQVRIPSLSSAMLDPLMINVSSAVANISDQKFYFDLDADGTEEMISRPGAGTGFLALDKNGDGVINDGSELFGALTGNGFDELAEYDSDGNGWIDENDEIWDKLRVWCKGEDGEDILMDLKEADVGAIFLGYQPTDFAMMGESFRMNAMIRSSGFFLKESGGAGTIQHVDLAADDPTLAPEEGASEETDAATNVISSPSASASFTVIDGSGNAQTTSTQTSNTSSEETSKEESSTSKAEERRARARERAEENRRRRNEAIEKTAERRRIQKEQLDKLFEDRRIEKEQLEEERIKRADDREGIIEDAIERTEEISETLEELAVAV